MLLIYLQMEKGAVAAAQLLSSALLFFVICDVAQRNQ